MRRINLFLAACLFTTSAFAAQGDKFSPLAMREDPGVAIYATSGNVANASAVATLTPGIDELGRARTVYLKGVDVTGAGATAASNVLVTITGLQGAVTFTYVIVVPAGVNTATSPLIVRFGQPLAAAAPGGSITVTVAAFGAGNLNAVVNAHGFAL